LVAAGAPTAPASTGNRFNNPSINSFRYLLAGTTHLLLKKLGDLPKDLRDWYLGASGRSEGSNSWQRYITAFTSAFTSRLPYISDPGPGLFRTPFKELMCGW
jgi:hypothetical protein